MRTGGRLHYIDALRVAAFAVLIAYHSSAAFFTDIDWLLKNAEGSTALTLVMDFPRAWRLALLFFISGMGSWFVFRSNAGPGFLRERFVRLFVPLIFAMCVIVVPQVWIERMIEDGYQGSLWTFWTTRYFTEGRYPTGQFTWAHMWFVGYLVVMLFVCYPVFRLVVHPRMRPVMAWFERTAQGRGVYLFFLLPLVLNLALSPFFPRQTNALYNDGAWFAVWASWFGLGFLFARHHAQIIGSVIERRYASAALCALLTVLLYGFSFAAPGHPLIGGYADMTPLFKTLELALAWMMILALLGFGARHLNAGSAPVAWLNRKIFPLYIVHQTVIIAALYFVLPLEAGVWTKFLLVATATAAGSLAFAVAAEALPDPLKGLVGLTARPQRRPAPEPVQARS